MNKLLRAGDPWVLEVQQWLNATYSGKSGYNTITENGYTGWETIYGLIRALQIELSLTPADNFGAGTAAAWESKLTGNLIVGYKGNVVKIIDGGFRCKGFGNGKFDNTYSEEDIQTLKRLKEAAGFESPDNTFSSIWAKALFDMSAFSLLAGGDAKIQAMQKWLNKNYYDYTGIMPCDGIYQRNTNQALIYALQAEEGLSPSEATGTYGNLTTQLTPTLNPGDDNKFVPILKFGLLVNGFYDSDDFTTSFSDSVGNSVVNFRKFMLLPPYSNVADVTVIKGLLSSAGDTSRTASGVDTSTQLSYLQIQTLKFNNVSVVGRYLTGTVGIGSEERDKFLTVDECQLLFDEDMTIFPIYQDGGSYIEYFGRLQGYQDGVKAGTAATDLGIPKGVIIYFAVDLDIQGADIPGTVLEYFKGIRQSLPDYGYRIGVYGTRNVCSQTIVNGYAETAFVSNMSTGFSGNLGFKMPQLWAFDQFIEFTMGSGEGAVGIDQVAVSGRDQGFSHLENYVESSSFLEFLGLVQEQAKIYAPTGSNQYIASLVADYFRHEVYGSIVWQVVAGIIPEAFINQVNNAIPESKRVYDYTDPISKRHIGGAHCFAAIAGYLFHGIAEPNQGNIGDGCGWLGDLDTLLIDYWDNREDVNDPYLFGLDWIGGVADAGAGNFSYEDLIADVDAWNVFYQVKVNDLLIEDVFKSYLSGNSLYSRFSLFMETRFENSKNNSLAAAQDALLTTATSDLALYSFRRSLLGLFGGSEYLAADGLTDVKSDLCRAFSDKIARLASDEQTNH